MAANTTIFLDMANPCTVEYVSYGQHQTLSLQANWNASAAGIYGVASVAVNDPFVAQGASVFIPWDRVIVVKA
jgi:hypothetical protein